MYVVSERNTNKNPLKGPAKEERDALIRRMREEGQDLPTIAQKFGITTARVSQITAGAKKPNVEGDNSYTALIKLLQGAADGKGRVTVPLPTLIDKTQVTSKRATELISKNLQRDGLLTYTTTTKHNHDVGMFKEIMLTERGRAWTENIGRPVSVPTPSSRADVPSVGSGPVEKGHFLGDDCPGGHQRLAESIKGSNGAKADQDADLKAILAPKPSADSLIASGAPPEVVNEAIADELEPEWVPEPPKEPETASEREDRLSDAVLEVFGHVPAPQEPQKAPEPVSEPVSEPDPAERAGFELMYPLMTKVRSRKADLTAAAKLLERHGVDEAAVAALEAADAFTPLEKELIRYMESHGD